MANIDKAIDRLERQLEDCDLDPEEAKAIRDEIRDMERDYADQERWQEEGRDRGWC